MLLSMNAEWHRQSSCVKYFALLPMPVDLRLARTEGRIVTLHHVLVTVTGCDVANVVR